MHHQAIALGGIRAHPDEAMEKLYRRRSCASRLNICWYAHVCVNTPRKPTVVKDLLLHVYNRVGNSHRIWYITSTDYVPVDRISSTWWTLANWIPLAFRPLIKANDRQARLQCITSIDCPIDNRVLDYFRGIFPRVCSSSPLQKN